MSAPHTAALPVQVRSWLTTLQHWPARLCLFQITISLRQFGLNGQVPRPGAKSLQDPVRLLLFDSSVSCLVLTSRCFAAQLGQKMNLPRPQTLIMNFHLRGARMAHPTHIALTCRNTPRQESQDQVGNTAGSHSLAAAQCYHRRKCLGLNLLLHDSRGGLPSVLGFTTGTTAV
jgi:hypothetical protein